MPKVQSYLPKTATALCRSCGENLPITDYYLTKESRPNKNLCKRKLATCKMCTNDLHKKYRDKYISRPEILQQRSNYLKKLRAASDRCIQCTGQYKLNSSKICKPCYIRFWLSQAWMKIRKTDWYSNLSSQQQYRIVCNHEYAQTIVGQAEIANKTFRSHWPDEGLYQIKKPSKNPGSVFKLDNIGWRRKSVKSNSRIVPTRTSIPGSDIETSIHS